MTTDELEGFLEDRVPISIKRHTDWMPEECERVATIVVRGMFPAVQEPCRAPSEEVPYYPFRPYIRRAQGSHLHRTYQTTFFKSSRLAASRAVPFLNGAFHKLASRRRMPKGENFEPMLGSSADDRAGFWTLIIQRK